MKKILHIGYCLPVFILILFISCNKEEPIPAYIHIDKFTLTTNYTNEGSNSHKILDAWIYIDDQPVGAFEMPCTVPVLYQGTHTIKVSPGIKENGIAETRIINTFYERYESSITLNAGQITTVNPFTKYALNADFAWLEDFDGAGHTICKSDGVTPDAVMKDTSGTEVFEGTGSGVVNLTANGSSYFGETCSQFTSLPIDGSPVIIEMNYKCNTDFNVGIVGYDQGGNIQAQTIAISLNSKTDWNKIYINLSNELQDAAGSGAVKFRIFFSMLKDDSLSSSYFFLDNLKLIY